MKRLDDPALAHVADYFRALSEPLRLKILNSLGEKPRNVGELTELLECSQANVSKHLATLARMGFVQRTAQGTSAYFRIADPRVHQLCELACGQIAERYASQAELLGAASTPRRRRRSTKGERTPAAT